MAGRVGAKLPIVLFDAKYYNDITYDLPNAGTDKSIFATYYLNPPDYSPDYGGSLNFNTSQHFDTNLIFSQSLIESFSYGVWAKSALAEDAGNRPCGNADSAFGTSGTSILWSYPPGSPYNMYVPFRTATTAGDINVYTSNTLLTDWHYVVVTHNSIDGNKLYYDGELIGTNPETQLEVVYPFRIANDGDGVSYFVGSIATVQIFDYTVGPEQVALYYNKTKSRFGL